MHEQISWSDQKYKNLNRSESFVEVQWIEILNENCKNIVVANLYRPPDGDITDFISYLEHAMDNMDFFKYEIFIQGDFNIDFLDRGSENTKKNQVNSERVWLESNN